MNRQETVKALSILKAAYPMFYSKQTKGDLEITVNLWETIFANDDYQVVMVALKELISKHSGFPPDIAALRKQIDDMTFAAIGAPTDEELWRMLTEAVQMGWNRTREAFDRLPPILKRYLGAPETLAEFGKMEESTFNTVAKGQFLKQIGSIRERERFDLQTPSEVKALLASSVGRLPAEPKRLSSAEINDRRNRLLDRLDEMK